jgi:hypothetical protein
MPTPVIESGCFEDFETKSIFSEKFVTFLRGGFMSILESGGITLFLTYYQTIL